MEYIKNMMRSKKATPVPDKDSTPTTHTFVNKKNNNYDECVICLDEMKENELLTIIFCSHLFHKQCIDMWIKKKTICPLCDKCF